MSSSTDFLPTRESELVTWGNTFSALITAGAASYGLLPAQATAFAAVNSAWTDAYAAANADATNSTSAIVTKNDAKAEMIAMARELARIIQANPSVTDTQRSDLGLTVPDPVISPIPAPTIKPLVTVPLVVGNTVTLRLIDQTNPTRRGRPVDVAGASIYSFTGPTPPADINGWVHQGNTTHMQFDVAFNPALTAGTLVHFRAFYFNAKCQSGPSSFVASASLNGTMAAAA